MGESEWVRESMSEWEGTLVRESVTENGECVSE